MAAGALAGLSCRRRPPRAGCCVIHLQLGVLVQQARGKRGWGRSAPRTASWTYSVHFFRRWTVLSPYGAEQRAAGARAPHSGGRRWRGIPSASRRGAGLQTHLSAPRSERSEGPTPTPPSYARRGKRLAGPMPGAARLGCVPNSLREAGWTLAALSGTADSVLLFFNRCMASLDPTRNDAFHYTCECCDWSCVTLYPALREEPEAARARRPSPRQAVSAVARAGGGGEKRKASRVGSGPGIGAAAAQARRRIKIDLSQSRKRAVCADNKLTDVACK